mmetsp:Transcript_10847/g.16515  ORF Transcript_10847/g.16515 Transcript_10847/m.16515 type:complete len:205 (+) Transcript_10847:188-802(+)
MNEIRAIVENILLCYVVFVVLSFGLSIANYDFAICTYCGIPNWIISEATKYNLRLLYVFHSSKNYVSKIWDVLVASTVAFSGSRYEVIILCLLPTLIRRFHGTIRVFLPDWVEKLIIASSSSSDPSMPPLEVDERARTFRQQSDEHENSTMEKERQEWLVFDPSLGVIPREVRDRWKKEEAARDEVLKSAKLRAKKNLPPVRVY